MRTCVICDQPLKLLDERTCGSVICRRDYQLWLQEKKQICAICGKPLRSPRLHAAPVCVRDDCLTRWRIYSGSDLVKSQGRCRVCNVLATRIADKDCYCRDSVCLGLQGIFRNAERQQLDAERHREYVAAATVIRDKLLSERIVQSETNYSVVVVPHTTARLSAPDNEMLESFRNNLNEVIAKAFAETILSPDGTSHDDGSDLLSKKELPILHGTCSACRGRCCALGSDHAFISVGTIQSYRQRNPEKNAQEVFDEYLSNLPTKSIQNSCVFHTETGCNQPREMRSITCNAFLCPSLQEIRTEITAGVKGFFLVPEKDGEFYGNQFVEVTEIE